MTTEQALRDSGQTLELRDRRRLGYAEWGDPTGKPVLYFHGIHSSRLALYQEPAFFASHGVRFITLDRPGIGLSSFQRGRALLDWPDDVAQLADALGLARFAILSMTGGGMYALACAAQMPDRLTGVACVSPAAPLDAPGISVPGLTGQFMWLARHAPWALWSVYALLVPRLRRDPEHVYRMLTSGVSESGLRALAQPTIRKMAIASVLEAFRSGYWGEVQDVTIATRPWGLRLEDVPSVVHLWDGDKNNLIPPSHREYLARALPRAQTHICQGEGQLLIVGHMLEILQGIIESESASSTTA
jgi:pimeloyl-ACP methyl ester carboxylesterase